MLTLFLFICVSSFFARKITYEHFFNSRLYEMKLMYTLYILHILLIKVSQFDTSIIKNNVYHVLCFRFPSEELIEGERFDCSNNSETTSIHFMSVTVLSVFVDATIDLIIMFTNHPYLTLSSPLIRRASNFVVPCSIQ